MATGRYNDVTEQKQALLPSNDSETIEQFVDSIMPISEVRAYKYRAYLRNVRVDMLQKPFVEATRQDLLHVWRSIDALKVVVGNGRVEKPAEPWTRRDYRLITKRFYRWLRNEEFVKGFKIGECDETVGPEDILSDEELFKVYQACHSLRDKALSSTAYEGAFRPHELLRQKKSDVMFDEYGAVIYVRPATAESNAKTGARRVRVVNASPLLANWIENHPLRDRDAPLWVDQSSNTTFEQLRQTGWRKIVKRWAKEARLEKHVTPYLFRHTRLTHLAKYMTEAQLCVFAGWKIGSDMPRMYVHLSGRDVDDALLKMYGMKKEEEKQVKAPRKCVRCGHVNEANGELCVKCGMALTLTAALEKDQELESLKEKQRRQQETLDLILNTPGLAELFRNHTSSP